MAGDATVGGLEALIAAAGAGCASTDLADRLRLAHDASHYVLTPAAVVTATSTEQVAEVLRTASRAGCSVTFRSGGTSLSGQAVTDGVLVDVRRNQAGIEVLDDGARVRCGPGAVLRAVNARLAPYGRRLGPDPASEGACTVGGVVANNSSGMTSGTALTAYWTLDSMVLVLPSGTVLDTARPDATPFLRHREPVLYAGLERLRDHLRGHASLRARIEHQFSMKNTMGYGLNAFLDHDDPVQVLEHLVVGSEGTLAYIAEVTLRTVPVRQHAATTLCVLPSIDQAIEAVAALSDAAAVELMDACALRVAQLDPQADPMLRSLAVAGQAALLVELQEETADALAAVTERIRPAIDVLPLDAPAELTSEPRQRHAMWAVRKGLYAAVAGARRPGTMALLEDVVVPGRALAPTVRALGKVLERHKYGDAVVFGHAKDGNLHFMVTPGLADPSSLRRYVGFTDDLVDLVLGAGGSLKAEHGTGRMMAPYVRAQYGEALHEVMREIKALCDPSRVLSPGVVIAEDDGAHLRDLKTTPPVHPELDRCVECGYCEPVCPSRGVTTTPRQRIVLLREIAVARPADRAHLEAAYRYAAVHTCAADSLCSVACPVGIDTGAVMKDLRASGRSAPVRAAGHATAQHWAASTGALRAGVEIASHLPAPLLTATTGAIRAVAGEAGRDWLPQVDGLPGAGRRRSRLPALDSSNKRVDAIFFPSCIGALFGPEGPGEGAAPAFLALCERAGLRVLVPDGIDHLCCTTVWESKGLTDGARAMAERVARALSDPPDDVPIVTDAASCSHGLAGIGRRLGDAARERWAQRRVVDAVEFVRATILPGLPVEPARRVARVAVHPTCSTVHLRTVDSLVAVAAAAAVQVTVPTAWGCCGTAGDRGMLHPELVRSATHDEVAELKALERVSGRHDAYVSCNRTCEMGMTGASGRPYRHVLELLEEVTRPMPVD